MPPPPRVPNAGASIVFNVDTDETVSQLSSDTWLIEGELKDGVPDKLGDFEILLAGDLYTTVTPAPEGTIVLGPSDWEGIPNDRWIKPGDDDELVIEWTGEKDDPDDTDAGRFFAGRVSLSGTFDIGATRGGKSRLKSNSNVRIFDPAGVSLLQTIEFHTSCSQPLGVGDQFGSLIVDQCTPEP